MLCEQGCFHGGVVKVFQAYGDVKGEVKGEGEGQGEVKGEVKTYEVISCDTNGEANSYGYEVKSYENKGVFMGVWSRVAKGEANSVKGGGQEQGEVKDEGDGEVKS